MAYNYRSRRATRRFAKKSKTNFIITLILVAILLYAGILWVLPIFISSLGSLKNTVNPTKKTETQTSTTSSLAPPVLNIAFEATNSSVIDIKGYGTPNSKVSLYLDDEQKDMVDVSSDGAFEFKNVALSLGTNNIYGKSIDDENKESLPSKTFKIIFDDEKPHLNIKEPEDGRNVSGGDKKIKITGITEPNAKVFINDSLIIVDKDGNFSSDQVLNDGENIFNVKAQDYASNTTEQARRVTYTP